MAQPSARVPRPTGVLITRSISPALIMSTMVFSPICPVPSECFRTVVHSIPLVRRNCAVPSVARIWKPNSEKPRAGSIPVALSLSASEIKTVPDLGSGPKAAI